MLLNDVIFAAFAAELLWMMRVSSFPFRYLFENWLNVVIAIGAAMEALGAETEWIASVRVMRAAVAMLIAMRAALEFRILFTRRGAPMLIGISFFILLGLGALFFWFDPDIKSFTDGVWLAFTTGTTVGYGDLVPSTPATRLIAVVTVLIGVALTSVFTGSVVATFIGGEETLMRENLQGNIVALRGEIATLMNAEELRFTIELHREVLGLRQELTELRTEIHSLRSVAASGPMS